MKVKQLKLCRNLLPAASLLALAAPLALLCGGPMVDTAVAQTTAQNAEVQSATLQTPRVAARITRAVDERKLVTLRGNVHPLARPEFDRGAVEDSQPANRMMLLLKRSDDQEATLRQLLDDQQSKASPSYHAWLTPEQFGKQFGPADEDVQAVTDWLMSRGFTGIKVGAGRTTIEFSGSIGQVRNAFHTEIHHFSVNGEAHMANIADPQIPAALVPVVGGVLSLNNFRRKAQSHRVGTFRRTKATGEIKPLFTFSGLCGLSPCHAVGPGDFRTIYNVPYVPSTMDGTGVTIAIVQDSNINVADVQDYRALFGLPANFTSSNIILNGPDPGVQGPDSFTDDEIEADLDVELAGGVAPGATINLVVSEDSQSIGVLGTDLSAVYIIDNNIAPVMSESFAGCEAEITAAGEPFYDLLWEQASAEGITVIVSAGDSGSDSCEQGLADFSTKGLSVNGLASTPFNVAISGTDFNNGATFWNTTNAPSTQISAKGYVPETTWNDGCASTATVGSLGPCTASIVVGDAQTQVDLVGGGGGPSSLVSSGTPVNAKPSWQIGTPGNPADTFRDVPDLSFFAGDGRNNSFYIICQTDANTANGGSATSCDLNSPFDDFLGVGGTSAGAPAFAGIMALVNQKLGRQGNANYVLYRVYKKNTAGTICTSAASPASTCIFYDTTVGNNSVACQGGTTNCSNTTSGNNQYGVLVDPAHLTTPAWTTTPNYDLATGLGSINAANLITAWDAGSADTVAITAPASGTVNITHGALQPFTVTVTSGSGTPTGHVTLIAKPTGKPEVGIGDFSDNGPFALASGTVTFSTTLLPGGTSYPVIASYGGDGTFAPGTSAAVNVTVNQEASLTSVSAVTFDSSGNPTVHSGAISLAYGSGYILQLLVEDSHGDQCSGSAITCPTGTVTLTDNTLPLKDFSNGDTASLNSIGVAEDQFVQLPVGTNSLIAAYSGDNSYNTSTSPATVVTITKAATTIGVASSASSATIGQNVTLTATIGTQSTGVGPTGTVTFSAGGTSIGTAPIVPVNASPGNAVNLTFASGTATLTIPFTSPGTKSITATYATGDGNYTGSGPSTATTVTVSGGTQATTTTVTASAASLPPGGGNVTLTATVTATVNGGPGPTGTVQFIDNNTAIGSGTCMSTAGTGTTRGTCVATLLNVALTKTASITGSYSGDSVYASTGPSAPFIVTVAAKQVTTTAATSSTSSIASGGSVTLTANVTGTTNNGAGPTGTVQFMNGTTALGTAATCTPTAGTSSTPGTCTATLMTTLSLLTPPPEPRHVPNFPAMPTWIVASSAGCICS